jgi:hypothetical protein
MVPQEAVSVIFTGIALARAPPTFAVTDREVLPPDTSGVLLLPAVNKGSVIAAPEYAKSVDAASEEFDTVALTVNVAAPAEDPIAEEMPTVATPLLSVRAVAEVSDARLELRLKLTSLFGMPTPIPSFTVALAKKPLEPIAVTIELDELTIVARIVAAVEPPPPVDEKSVVPATLEVDTTDDAVNVAAPADTPAVGAIPTVATPIASVNAVVEDKVATVELRLNVTNLLPIAAPDPSCSTAFAEYVPDVPIVVTVVGVLSLILTAMVGAVALEVEPEPVVPVPVEPVPELEVVPPDVVLPLSPPPPPQAVSTATSSTPVIVLSSDIFTALFIPKKFSSTNCGQPTPWE